MFPKQASLMMKLPVSEPMDRAEKETEVLEEVERSLSQFFLVGIIKG